MSSASTSEPQRGALVLVATPIGNLGDMSVRAVDALRSADAIACEDSRHTQKLLNHFGIHTKTFSLHQHNERERVDSVVHRIQAGEVIALVTDAGMPAISDPGEVVVAAVAQAGLPVTVIPGPSAVPSALAVSGLPTERFVFEGFIPRKGVERRQRLAEIAVEARTVVMYESPNRVKATLVDLVEVCGGQRSAALVRELTKIHEEVIRGSLQELVDQVGDGIKGECVIVLHGAERPVAAVDDDVIIEALAAARSQGVSKKDAVAKVAEELAVPKNRVYDLSVRS